VALRAAAEPQIWLHDQPARQVTLEARGERIFVSFVDEPVWLPPTLDRLRHVLELPQGWDSYGGDPVSLSTAYYALRFLASVTTPDTPPPSIVPGVAGELQIEWHVNGMDIEVGVDPTGRLAGFFEDARTAQEWEEVPMTDLAPIRGAVETLTERSRASRQS
jgi:hypothetical protein